MFRPTTGVRRVSDFAQVVDTVKTIQSAALFFDVANQRKYDNIVSIGILKKSDANEVKVTNAVKALIPGIASSSYLKESAINIPFDSSEYTQSAVDDALDECHFRYNFHRNYPIFFPK